jgi:hypothetical protein
MRMTIFLVLAACGDDATSPDGGSVRRDSGRDSTDGSTRDGGEPRDDAGPGLDAWRPPYDAALPPDAPSYIASMSAFEVRALEGAFAPANGTSSMRSVTPAEWLAEGDYSLTAVLIAWSGGFKAIGGSRLFVHGGGHADSANNGIYVFDYAGADAPAGWSLRQLSALDAVMSTEGTYADGRPTSVHTYDGCVYAAHNDQLYRFGGSSFQSGFATSSSWRYDIAGDAWHELPDFPGGGTFAISLYDPVTRKILVASAMASTISFSSFFFRTDDETWSDGVEHSEAYYGDAVAAWDSTRNRALVVTGGESRIVEIDFAAETVTTTATSSLPAGTSIFYDARLDRYWAFGGDGDEWSTLVEIDAETFATTTHTLTGDSIEVSAHSGGSYGRFVFMPEWRAFGTVASASSPAYVVRLP